MQPGNQKDAGTCLKTADNAFRPECRNRNESGLCQSMHVAAGASTSHQRREWNLESDYSRHHTLTKAFASGTCQSLSRPAAPLARALWMSWSIRRECLQDCLTREKTNA